nr:TPA: hypothetical protein BN1204_038010 [Neospora caninum Liverpool]
MIVQGSELFVSPLDLQPRQSQRDASASQDFHRAPQSGDGTDPEQGSTGVSENAAPAAEVEEVATEVLVMTCRHQPADDQEKENAPESKGLKRLDGAGAANAMYNREHAFEQEVLILESDGAVPNSNQASLAAVAAVPETLGKACVGVPGAHTTAHTAHCLGIPAALRPLLLHPADGNLEIHDCGPSNPGGPSHVGKRLSRNQQDEEECLVSIESAGPAQEPGNGVLEKGDRNEKVGKEIQTRGAEQGDHLTIDDADINRTPQPMNSADGALRETDGESHSPPNLLDAAWPVLGAERGREVYPKVEDGEPVMQQTERLLPVEVLESRERREVAASLL